jgi:hypothetical protein
MFFIAFAPDLGILPVFSADAAIHGIRDISSPRPGPTFDPALEFD